MVDYVLISWSQWCMITATGLLFSFHPLTPPTSMPKAKTAKRGTSVAKKSAKSAAATGRGGVRPGAGRPVGSGKYGCKTKAVRVPEHLISEIQAFVMKKIKSERKS